MLHVLHAHNAKWVQAMTTHRTERGRVCWMVMFAGDSHMVFKTKRRLNEYMRGLGVLPDVRRVLVIDHPRGKKGKSA